MSTVETPSRGRWRLDRKERRRLGVTLFNVLAKARELGKRGEFDREDIPSMALEIQGMIIADNPQLFREPGWDQDRMDRILEFIERFLEIIAKWLPIFLAFV